MLVDTGDVKMDAPKKQFKTIDEYIRSFPKDVRDKLLIFRKTVQKAAPEAEETISYQMPTFTLNGNLVHFAAFKNHIGFYPFPSSVKSFKKELTKYKTAKGSIQFPMDQKLPLTLIRKVVKYRVKENLKKVKK